MTSDSPLIRVQENWGRPSLFNEEFARWQIRLPAGAVALRGRGKIVKAGWAIWYLFGANEKGEYLDYYAAHRMTNDRHVRIHADGTELALETIPWCRLVSPDPDEDARLQAAHDAETQRIAQMLKDKGFGIDGDEPGGVQINRYLQTRPTAADERRSRN